MSEPRTEAGKRLLHWFSEDALAYATVADYLPLIEAEAAAPSLTVERLARAMHPIWMEPLPDQRPATLTDHEWGQMALTVTLNRKRALEEAAAILAALIPSSEEPRP